MAEVEEPSSGLTARQAGTEAEERGAIPHHLDGSELTNKRTALDGIAAALDFPEWSGRNLDALYDCLTDLSWLPEGEHVLIWSHHRVLARNTLLDTGDPVAVLASDYTCANARIPSWPSAPAKCSADSSSISANASRIDAGR